MGRKYVFLGVFVVVTLGLLMWLAANVGGFGSASDARYTVRLKHAAGLVEDNAVKIAGVKVGVVERVEIDHDVAVLTLRLDKTAVLHTDAHGIVRAKSLLGEKYMQLQPGSLDQPVLEAGSEIARVDTTFEIDEVLNALEPLLGGDAPLTTAVAPLAKRVDGLIASAQGEDGQPPIVTREELRASIEDAQKSVQALRRITEDNEQGIKDLVENSNRVLGDPRVPRIIANLDRASATAAKDLPALIKKADEALTNLEHVTAEMTPERAAKVGQAIDDLQVAAASLRTLGKDLEGSGGDLAPLLSDLAKLAKRAASIDERALRKFLQSEGVRVNLRTPSRAKDELRELGLED